MVSGVLLLLLTVIRDNHGVDYKLHVIMLILGFVVLNIFYCMK